MLRPLLELREEVREKEQEREELMKLVTTPGSRNQELGASFLSWGPGARALRGGGLSAKAAQGDQGGEAAEPPRTPAPECSLLHSRNVSLRVGQAL